MILKNGNCSHEQLPFSLNADFIDDENKQNED